MLAQTDLERERYEARRKAQMDHASGRDWAYSRGEKIGVIRCCQHLLGRAETPTEQLKQLSLDQLTALADELHTQVSQQR